MSLLFDNISKHYANFFMNVIINWKGKLKAHELRTKTKSELLGQVKDLKAELQTLRIAQVTGGAPAKLAKIGVIRKNVARVLTVANQLQKSKVSI